MSLQHNEECLIWPGYPANTVATDSSGKTTTVYGSARAGGDYKLKPQVGRRLTVNSTLVDTTTRARLTTILINMREQGEPIPEVTRQNIDEAKNANNLPVHTRAEKLLQHIGRLTQTIGQEIDTTPHSSNFPGLLAWTESIEESEIAFLEDYLRNQGWLEGHPGTPVVSVQGYSRLTDIGTGQDSDEVFVAMWFCDKMEQVYTGAIEPAIREAGYNPQRVGQGQTTDRIDDEAEAKIRASRLVIADFTHGHDGARGSVYYEAGFARALGKPIIYTAERGSNVHFNLDHFLRLEWTDAEDLRERLSHRIRNLPELQR